MYSLKIKGWDIHINAVEKKYEIFLDIQLISCINCNSCDENVSNDFMTKN